MAASYKLIQQGPSQSYLLNALFSAKQVCSFGLVSPFPCCGYLIVYSKYAYFLRIRHFLAPILIVQFHFLLLHLYTSEILQASLVATYLLMCVHNFHLRSARVHAQSHVARQNFISSLVLFSLVGKKRLSPPTLSPLFSCSFGEVFS